MPAALTLAWLALAPFDFFYPVWHRALDIDRTVAVYGPQNRNRQGFAETDAAEHRRLFAALVDAVHDSAAERERRLRALAYHNAAGRRLDTLLTEPEIQHLHDVGRLLGRLLPLGGIALLGWLVLSLLARRLGLRMPRVRALLAAVAAGFALIGLAVLAVGPVTVFYQLHRWVFPPGRPWFFYYQDSLMTTLMQAPNLFGPIALSLAAATALALLGLFALTRRLETV